MSIDDLAVKISAIETKQEVVDIIIGEIKEDIKETKKLAEDVHIMAINLTNMQKTLSDTREKVEELSQKDYNNYKDATKKLKDTIIAGIGGSLVTVIIAVVVGIIKYLIGGDV